MVCFTWCALYGGHRLLYVWSGHRLYYNGVLYMMDTGFYMVCFIWWTQAFICMVWTQALL